MQNLGPQVDDDDDDDDDDDAADRPGGRRPLRQIPLVDGHLLLHRIITVGSVVLVVVAVITYFMDWHAVPDDGNRLDGLGCMFLPDCDPGHFDYTPPVPETYTGRVTRDSGFDHSGPIVPILLALIAALAVVSARRPRWPFAMGAAISSFAVYIVSIAALFHLDHLFEVVWPLWPEQVFGMATLALLFAVLSNLIAQPALYLLARRRVERAPALPRAQIVAK